MPKIRSFKWDVKNISPTHVHLCCAHGARDGNHICFLTDDEDEIFINIETVFHYYARAHCMHMPYACFRYFSVVIASASHPRKQCGSGRHERHTGSRLVPVHILSWIRIFPFSLYFYHINIVLCCLIFFFMDLIVHTNPLFLWSFLLRVTAEKIIVNFFFFT